MKLWRQLRRSWNAVRLPPLIASKLLFRLVGSDFPSAQFVFEPDEAQVTAHLDPGYHGRHLGALDLRPPDGHLGYWNVQSLRYVEQLYVECPENERRISLL